MDLIKSFEFFDPAKCDGTVHIIGCGSVGGCLAELIVRLGVTNLVLYDFDEVEPHNIANQLYTTEDLGKPKVEALAKYLTKINPELANTMELVGKGWKPGMKLDGYIFLAVDNIDTRRAIAESVVGNPFVKAIFDIRTRLVDAQHFAADWSKPDMQKALLNSMAFTHEEAKAATPMSACHVELSVAPTIRCITSLCVANFMNFLCGRGIRKLIEFNPFSPDIMAF